MIREGEDKSSPLLNRIRKNYRHVRKWAKRTQTNCFRIYDRDIREYPVAIDFYAGRFCVHCFLHAERTEDKSVVIGALEALFGVAPDAIYWKERIKRGKVEQYEKVGESREFFTVFEYGVKFKVNLLDYLDTGLFLDHRETRRRVAACCTGKRLLNLFAYTASFSIHAAMRGALFTKSVDMSNTYTEWSRDNFLLNSLPLANNEIIRADCLKFLDEEKGSYDVIIIDPPTLSRSKKMDQMFDVQIDYISLITKALRLLTKDGTLFFSTNLRSFSFDTSAFPSCIITDISEKTLPLDFHDQKIHRCYKINAL